MSRSLGAALLLAGTGLVLLALIWAPVVLGQRVMVGGDVLYEYLPWSGEPGAHAPANTLMSDVVAQDLVWQTVVKRDVAAGRLPLWNQDAGSGTPILANDQPGVFSPFTWIAMPFPPAAGLSIAMLAKLLVAATGMMLMLRAVGTTGVAAVFGAVAFASSSFMAGWLAWPMTSVAAFMPWVFALAEVYLSRGYRWTLPALALVIAMQFFGGHAETSFHVSLGVAVYTAIRWFATGRSLTALAGLAAAVITGTLIAGIQLAPFIDLLHSASLVGIRTSAGYGAAHLNLAAVTSWVFPNAVGNPGIDGLPGRPPNFNESTGFAGVAAIVLSPVGLWFGWTQTRSVVAGLAAVAAVAAGAVYGPLSPLMAALPGFQVTNNVRMLLLLCFCVAAFGAIGLDGVMRAATPSLRAVATPWLVTGVVGMVMVAGLDVLTLSIGGRVDSLLPHYHLYLGYWLVAGGLSFIAAAAFAYAGLGRVRRELAAAGLCILAMTEGGFYVVSFDRTVPAAETPPPSDAMNWLETHAAGRPVAALGQALPPESGLLYGQRDVREYEILTDPRESDYWSAADPGYTAARAYMEMDTPGAAWLAAAGVAYVITPAGTALPGTTIVYDSGGVAIAEVPTPRPFVYPAAEVIESGSATAATLALSHDPLGPVVVEGCCAAAGPADITLLDRADGEVRLEVTAQSAATVVVNQAYQSGWMATVDGISTPVMPADVLFMAVEVPAGKHIVRLDYRPASVLVGGVATCAGVLVLLLLIVAAVWRPASKPARNATQPRS